MPSWLAAQGLQRLNFLADCKDAGAELIPYQGLPVLEGPEGQLVELELAIGKERSVERAQLGSRDGLRDRAKLKGLPSAPVRPYGYTWTEDDTRLSPSAEWTKLELICRAALDGAPLRGLRQELHRRGPRLAETLLHSGLVANRGRFDLMGCLGEDRESSFNFNY